MDSTNQQNTPQVDPQVEKDYGRLLDVSNRIKSLPNHNELVNTILMIYKAPEVGFWKDGKVPLVGKNWIILKSPTPKTIEGVEFKIRLFGPPIPFVFDNKKTASVMLSVELPEAWKGESDEVKQQKMDAVAMSRDFVKLIIEVGYLMSFKIPQLGGGSMLFAPVSPIAASAMTDFTVFVPYIFANEF